MQARHNYARFRSERIFHVAARGWYVESREGAYGPFRSRPEARAFLRYFIDRVCRRAANPRLVASDGALLSQVFCELAFQGAKDRRIGQRRVRHDRRHHIRFEEDRGTRRSGEGRRRDDMESALTV